MAELTGEALIAVARGYLGVPFRHQGRTKHGVDCIGLVILARDELEPWPHATARHANYRRNPMASLLEEISACCVRIDQAEPGAVALIKWPKQKHPGHVGIVTPQTIVHSYATAGKVIETNYGQPWLRMTHSLWRLPGIRA